MTRYLSDGAALLALMSCLVGCSTEVLHDLEESEANQILVALQHHGISADKVRVAEGNKAAYAVRVGRSEAARAWGVLRQENLPRPRSKGLGEVFGSPGLVPTPTQERALMHAALSGELSRTLQAVEGVLEARVHLVLPARDPLSPPDAPPPSARASVLLRVSSPPPLREDEVRRLIAGSVEGLRPEAVTVVMATSGSPRTAGAVTETRLASVGPFLVAESSRGGLRATLISGLALALLLSLALIVLVLRSRRLLARARTARPAAAPSEGSRSFAAHLESSLGLMSQSLARPRTGTAAQRGPGDRQS